MPATLGRVGRKAANPPVAKSASRPPPVKGWNTVLPLDAMKPEYAVLLDNWFAQPGYVELRGGHAEHSDTSETGSAIESLMTYHAVNPSNDKMFGAVGTKIYDVTGASPSSVVTSLTNARWQHINFTTSGGKFLYIVNGEDSPQYYDGSSWSTPTINNITAADIVHIASHKSRIWFVLANSTKAAYLPVDSIQGNASTVELGTFFTRGGYLNAIGTWTRDGGNGPDDYIVFISSRGQVVVFQGTDPSDASKWSHVGTYDIGAPIGRRCFLKIGADLAIITVDGVLPMSLVPGIERGAAAKIALTANIQPTMNDAAKNGASLFGWQLISYPKGTMALLNVPLTADTFNQYVMNTITGAWSRFTGINAYCWEIYQDRLFLGGPDGVVYEADVGSVDPGDASITGNMKTAFDYFETRGQLKRWTMIRPKITVGATITPAVGINVDFRSDETPAVSIATLSDLALWDQAIWDTDEWPPEQVFRNEWATITGVGYCASTQMLVSVSGSGNTKPVLRVNGFDYIYEPGGPV